ncbi:unnamed protein product [Oncorhynchus mykiss]|uniref:ZP domain-containing protein n=1 Tax=Oncorhynchus mykiss TaxID=8022 RepID=A0A060XB38_ONCMY|nr:unnamed protein product [Oncorhynchus mykiss]
MGPSVQCSNETMTLRVKGGRAPHFLVDGGDGSPVLPLSRMPTHCGFSVKRSRRHVFFVAPYQGCHVTQEGGNYVLPLRLWGAPMTMSCPVAPPPPPSVSCYLSGMVVKLSMAANALQVKVSGVWEPLLAITQQCGLTIETFFGGVVITAPYTGPCVELEDDKRLLFMLSGAGELTLSCPAGLPPTEPVMSGYPLFYQLSQYHFPPYPPQPPSSPTAATTMSKQTHSPKPSSQAMHMPRKGDPQVPQTPEFHPFYPYHFPPYPPQRYFPTSAPTTSPKHTQSPQPVTQVLHMPPKADPQVPQTPEFHPFHPYHFPLYPPQRYFPTSAPTTSPKHTQSPQPVTQVLHMPPKGYPQVPQMPDFKMFYPYHFTTHLPQPYFPSASTTTPKQTNQALHMPPKGYPQVPLSYQFPQYNFPGFFPQRSVPRAPPIASQLDNQNNPQKYHYSDSSYRQSATPSVTASTIPGTTPQAQPMQPFMQYDQYPMVRSWNPYASPVFPPHYGTVPYHYQGPRE